MAVTREEIFGPLLPIIAYDTLDEAIAYVNARPRPLALYYFDTDRSRIRHVLQHTVSGGVTINDTIYHFAQEELPVRRHRRQRHGQLPRPRRLQHLQPRQGHVPAEPPHARPA